jgi:hypothetical protein
LVQDKDSFTLASMSFLGPGLPMSELVCVC